MRMVTDAWLKNSRVEGMDACPANDLSQIYNTLFTVQKKTSMAILFGNQPYCRVSVAMHAKLNFQRTSRLMFLWLIAYDCC